jgi:hypothetical protein
MIIFLLNTLPAASVFHQRKGLKSTKNESFVEYFGRKFIFASNNAQKLFKLQIT